MILAAALLCMHRSEGFTGLLEGGFVALIAAIGLATSEVVHAIRSAAVSRDAMHEAEMAARNPLAKWESIQGGSHAAKPADKPSANGL